VAEVRLGKEAAMRTEGGNRRMALSTNNPTRVAWLRTQTVRAPYDDNPQGRRSVSQMQVCSKACWHGLEADCVQ
jgi:hypothetical protein